MILGLGFMAILKKVLWPAIQTWSRQMGFKDKALNKKDGSCPHPPEKLSGMV